VEGVSIESKKTEGRKVNPLGWVNPPAIAGSAPRLIVAPESQLSDKPDQAFYFNAHCPSCRNALKVWAASKAL